MNNNHIVFCYFNSSNTQQQMEVEIVIHRHTFALFFLKTPRCIYSVCLEWDECIYRLLTLTGTGILCIYCLLVNLLSWFNLCLAFFNERRSSEGTNLSTTLYMRISIRTRILFSGVLISTLFFSLILLVPGYSFHL